MRPYSRAQCKIAARATQPKSISSGQQPKNQLTHTRPYPVEHDDRTMRALAEQTTNHIQIWAFRANGGGLLSDSTDKIPSRLLSKRHFAMMALLTVSSDSSHSLSMSPPPLQKTHVKTRAWLSQRFIDDSSSFHWPPPRLLQSPN